MWETKSRKFMTSNKVNIDLYLIEFSAIEIVTWKCRMSEFTTSRYDMILDRDLLTALGMDFQFSANVIIGRNITYEWWPSPMINVSNYKFTSLTDKTVKLK